MELVAPSLTMSRHIALPRHSVRRATNPGSESAAAGVAIKHVRIKKLRMRRGASSRHASRDHRWNR
jgi:hypothetical protein